MAPFAIWIADWLSHSMNCLFGSGYPSCCSSELNQSNWQAQLKRPMYLDSMVERETQPCLLEDQLTVIGCYFCSYFCPFLTQLHFTFLTPHLSPLCLPLLCLCPYASTLTNKRQGHNSIGTTGHQTTLLLGYRHSETVLLWFLTRILRGNLFCRHRTLPPLKVPDFLDTEHK